jgi:hypothetical protein
MDNTYENQISSTIKQHIGFRPSSQNNLGMLIVPRRNSLILSKFTFITLMFNPIIHSSLVRSRESACNSNIECPCELHHGTRDPWEPLI